MKKFYFKLNEDIIVDVVEYEYDGYVEVELNETHLPAGINAGYYRLSESAYFIDEELKNKIEAEQPTAIPGREQP